MSKYLAQRDTALRMIRDKGAAVSISRVVLDYDPASGGTDSTLVLQSDCFGVTLPATKGTIQGFDDRLRALVATDKLRFWMLAGVAFDPAPDDILTDGGGGLWAVAGATRLSPDDDLPIYHKVGVSLGASIPASPKLELVHRYHNAGEMLELVERLRQ